MIKLMNTGLAALIAAGAMAATATPAAAHEWDHHDNDAGALIVGGIAGLALGAALSSHNNGYGGGYYHRGYGYGGGYYGNGYGNGGGYYSNGYSGYYGNGYGGGYYGNGYGGGYGNGYGNGYRSRICVQRTRVWDPYEEENVVRETRYRC